MYMKKFVVLSVAEEERPYANVTVDDGPEGPYSEVTPKRPMTVDLGDNPYQNVEEVRAEAAQAAGGDNPYADVEVPKQDPKVGTSWLCTIDF